MQNWVLKLEEAIRYQDLNDLADDVTQGLALTGIAAVLIAWVVMLATI
jgi:hypothetical protein